MTILFSHTPPDLYGASRSLLRLTSRLSRDGHTVLVILPRNGPLVERLEHAGVHVIILPTLTAVDRLNFRMGTFHRLAADLWQSVAAAVRIIRKHKVDLVHTNTALILTTPLAAFGSGRPHFWHIRECFGEFPRLWRVYRRLVVALSDQVIAISRAVAQQFEGPGLSEKVKVIHNGLPREEFEGVSHQAVSEFRRTHGLGAESCVAMVGRIKLRRKGQEVFLRAAKILAGDFPRAKFLVVGGPFPGYEDHLLQLQTLCREMGIQDRVVFAGELADPRAAYKAADVTVHASSLPEPFGGVIAEAMAMGKPVVATNLGGAKELVEHGVTGLLVPPDDPAAMAAAIARIMGNPDVCREMGRRAKQRFLALFEFEAFYDQITNLYSKLLSPHAASNVNRIPVQIGDGLR